jgi:hypothetical protein
MINMEERYYNKEFTKLFKDCISDIKTLIGDKEISLEGEGIFPTDIRFDVQQELYARSVKVDKNNHLKVKCTIIEDYNYDPDTYEDDDWDWFDVDELKRDSYIFDIYDSVYEKCRKSEDGNI